MPRLIDILENEVIAPAIRHGREEGLRIGRQEGRDEARQEGRRAGMLFVLGLALESRFGPLPTWAPIRLASFSTAKLETVATRFFTAPSLEDLLS